MLLFPGKRLDTSYLAFLSQPIFHSIRLRDPDDDVRSVAATCITPIVHHVVERLSNYVDSVLDVLWDCLGDMKDDLSSSVGFVMDLLGNHKTLSDATDIADSLCAGKLLSFDRIIAFLMKPNNS